MDGDLIARKDASAVSRSTTATFNRMSSARM